MSFAPGQPVHVPDALFGAPCDEAPFDLVIFCQAYLADPMDWKLIVYFANHPGWNGLDLVAELIGEPISAAQRQLLRLAKLGLLEEALLVTGPIYRLTQRRMLRRAVLRFREADASSGDLAAGAGFLSLLL